jgi:uncharacterized integral membrane protein
VADSDAVTSDKQPGKQRRLDTRTTIALVLIGLVLIFVFENSKHVSIRFLAPTASVPLWIALLLPLAIGVGIGLLIGQRRSKED